MTSLSVDTADELVDFLIALEDDNEVRRRVSLQGLIDTAKWVKAVEASANEAHAARGDVPVQVRLSDLHRLDSFLSWLRYRHGGQAQLPETEANELGACAVLVHQYAASSDESA